MRKTIVKSLKFGILLALCSGLTGCDDMRVYGSVGVSSYSGYYGSPSLGTSISIGGRLF